MSIFMQKKTRVLAGKNKYCNDLGFVMAHVNSLFAINNYKSKIAMLSIEIIMLS